MKAQFFGPIAAAALFFGLHATGAAQTSSITIALIPTVTPDAFELENKGNGPTKTAKLSFDLQAIPKGAITSAVLRLVPAAAQGSVQQVRIFADEKSTVSIGQLTVDAKLGRPAESTGTELANAVANAVNAGNRLELYLRAYSIRTSQQYYSNNAASVNRPRLIVSWADNAAPVTRNGQQLRYRGNPDDATPWKYERPNGAAVSKLLTNLGLEQIAAGPAFRGDEMLLIANTPGAEMMLYGIGWDGSKRWVCQFPQLADKAATWKYLYVDEIPRHVLAFASNGTIRQFNWPADTGAPVSRVERKVKDMTLSRRPAVSAGGMLTYLSDNGYVYSLSPMPGVDELWRSTSVGKVPPPVLSPRGGDGLVYFFADENGSKGFYAVDAARGEVRFPPNGKRQFPGGSTLGNFPDFQPPLAVSGKDRDWVFLSSFGNGHGVLEGYTNFTRGVPSSWKEPKTGPSSRCVAPPPPGNEGQIVYCVQNDRLRGFTPDGANPYTSAEGGLGAASNLVADGARNIYFWNKGLFYGFDNHCAQLFAVKVNLPVTTEGSAAFELSVGSNGVFYARSVKEVFAIRPTQSSSPTAVEANTRYATQGNMQMSRVWIPTNGPVALAAIGGTLSLGDTRIPAGADVSCSASNGISFGPAFTVEKGASLRCGMEGPPQ
jgi:hypothetical protein